MSKSILIHNISELSIAAKTIIDFSSNHKIWLFEGSMASGKTTLIKEICQQLGVQNHVKSPTYSLVNEYLTKNGDIIYHFDFYRLKNETEALDYGLDEYFESGNLCLCEWPSVIPNLLPNEYLMLNLNVLNDASREIELELFPSKAF